MESQTRKADWRSILLLIFNLGGIALTFVTAISTLVMAFITQGTSSEFPNTSDSSLQMALIAGAIFAIGVLLTPAAWLSLQRVRGNHSSSLQLPSMHTWAWIVIIALWIAAIALAQFLYKSQGPIWFIPLMHFLSIALPVYLVVRIGVNHISLGSSQRAWGVFGSGMLLSPILAMFGEIIALFLFLLPAGLYLGANPDKMIHVQMIVEQIGSNPDIDNIFHLLEPFIMDPLLVILGLVFLGVLVPIIEETVKSIGVWLLSDRLESLAQGFALGLLSGAGFALAESLFATITPDDSWAINLSMRAFSGSMHMLASGLVGLGIAYARLEKRNLMLVSMTLLAMLLHGFWNTGAVLAAAGGLRAMVSMPDLDILGTLMALIGMGIIMILITGTIITLTLLNRRFRNTASITESEKPASAVG